MPLSWNEIKDRALRFSRDWAQRSPEDAEAKKLGSDADCVTFLFKRYQALTSLLSTEKPKRGRAKASAAQVDGAA
ncbi:hypothetical protein [uncultured Aquimonas sp.]|uniref:hypothetical protein n=1 Tax=uncultured Aquimonas sp. TaxID=385483 RepID=UPI000869C73A|nr:hypothetical protein [uncultured Aquimonas sp.]ODU45301.1 MAG: hypothetical protein ABS96_14675 [Xanthomonadaceae bacterium SCN 69-123]